MVLNMSSNIDWDDDLPIVPPKVAEQANIDWNEPVASDIKWNDNTPDIQWDDEVPEAPITPQALDTDGHALETVDAIQSGLTQQYGKTNTALRNLSRWGASNFMDQETIDKYLPKTKDVGTIGFGEEKSTDLANPVYADKLTGVRPESRARQQELMKEAGVYKDVADKAYEAGNTKDYIQAKSGEIFANVKNSPMMMGDSAGETLAVMSGPVGIGLTVTTRVDKNLDEYKLNNNNEDMPKDEIALAVALHSLSLFGERLSIKAGLGSVMNTIKGKTARGLLGFIGTIGGEYTQERFDTTLELFIGRDRSKDINGSSLDTFKAMWNSKEAEMAGIAGMTMAGTLATAGNVGGTAVNNLKPNTEPEPLLPTEENVKFAQAIDEDIEWDKPPEEGGILDQHIDWNDVAKPIKDILPSANMNPEVHKTKGVNAMFTGEAMPTEEQGPTRGSNTGTHYSPYEFETATPNNSNWGRTGGVETNNPADVKSTFFYKKGAKVESGLGVGQKGQYEYNDVDLSKMDIYDEATATDVDKEAFKQAVENSKFNSAYATTHDDRIKALQKLGYNGWENDNIIEVFSDVAMPKPTKLEQSSDFAGMPHRTEGMEEVAGAGTKANPVVTIEATPSNTDPLYEDLVNATPEDRIAYEKAHVEPVKKLAKKHGLEVDVEVSLGAYQGQTNPMMAVEIKNATFRDMRGGEFEVIQQDKIDAFASEFGKSTNQDAVAWYAPIYRGSREGQHGSIEITEKLDNAEWKALYDSVRSQNEGITPIMHNGRIDFMNFEDIPSKQFEYIVLKALSGYNGSKITGAYLDKFNSTGNLIEKENYESAGKRGRSRPSNLSKETGNDGSDFKTEVQGIQEEFKQKTKVEPTTLQANIGTAIPSYLFDVTEVFNDMRNATDVFVSKHLTGKIKGTKFDTWFRKVGGSQNGLGLLSREQEKAFLKHFRKLQSALSTSNLNAEDKAKRINEVRGQINEELFNKGAVRYLENPAVREQVKKDFPEVAKALDEVRDYIDILSQEAMERGLLLPSQFNKWKDRYLSRLYMIEANNRDMKIGDGIKLFEMKKGRKIDSIIDYLEENPDEAERLNAVLDPEVLVKMTIAKTQSNIGMDDFFRGVVDFDGLVEDELLVHLAEPVANLPKAFSPSYAETVVLPYIKDAQIENKAELIKDIKEQILIAQDNIKNIDMKDKAEIPTGYRYGPLAGLPVTADVASLVKAQIRMVQSPEMLADRMDNAFAKALSYFKWAKVPANIFAYPRNYISNFFQWSMSTGNPVAFFTYTPRALYSWAKKDKWYRMAQEAGMLDTNLVSAEIGDMMNAIKPSENKSIASVQKGMKKVGQAFGWVDDMVKLAHMIYSVEKQKMTPDEAVNIAQESHFDYTLTYDMIRAMRNPDMTRGSGIKLLGTLFPTFTQKVIAFLYDTIIHRPATLILMGTALTMLLRDDEKDKKTLENELKLSKVEAEELLAEIENDKPQWMQYNPLIKTNVSVKGGKVQVTYIDYSYSIPFGSLLTSANAIAHGDVFEGLGGLGLGGNPIQIMGDLKSNQDTFSGKQIYYEHDAFEGSKELAEYAFKQLAPATFTKIMSLYETRHPVAPRLIGVNTYTYSHAELKLRRVFDATDALSDAKKRTMSYVRKIQTAQKELDEGKISQEKFDLIKKANVQKIEHWLKIGTTAFKKKMDK